MKKDNKGFSLVELIVVVLIMGILAVALTPQVLKWVNRSRIATDFSTMDTVVSMLQTTLTNESAYQQRAGLKLEINKASGARFTGGTYSNVQPILESYLGLATGDLDDIKFKSGYRCVIETNSEGKVTATMYNDASPSVAVTGVPDT